MKNYMKKTSAKLMLLLACMVGQATSALADVSFSISDLSINMGEEKEVTINMTNTEVMKSLQLDIVIPEGLTYVEESATKTDRLGTGRKQMTLQAVLQPDGKLRVLVTSTSGVTIAAGDGAIATIKVKNTGLTETAKLKLEGIVCEAVSGTVNPADSEATVDVTNTAELTGEVKFYAETTELSIAPGEEKRIEVMLKNEADLSGMEFVLTLPEGLTLVEGEDGLFEYTDRIPFGIEFSYKAANNPMKVLLSGLSSDTFTGTDGAFFAFTVKADETLARNSEIKLNSFVVTDPQANGFELTDEITVSVINDAIVKQEANDEAYNKLSEELDELQKQLDEAKEKIAADDPDVADDFKDELQAVQDKIDADRTALEEAKNNVSLNSESTIEDADQIKADIEKAVADAEAAQQKSEADKVVDELRKALEEAKEKIAADYPEAKDNEAITGMEKDIEQDINMLENAIKAAADSGTLGTLDTATPAGKVKQEISDLLDAAAAITTGINGLNLTNGENVGFYNLNGQEMTSPRKGQIIIIKKSDGSTSKKMIQ